jgi:hypothetical protein
MHHKFRAKACSFDGFHFPSMKEGHRYLELKLLLQQGHITDLELQPKFPIIVGGVKICTYIADFRYREGKTLIVEDVKGFQTPVFRLKKKLFELCYKMRLRVT